MDIGTIKMWCKIFISISFVWTIHNQIQVLGSSMKLTQRNNHANISELLDNLLRGYDNSIRPDFGGPPAIVEVDIMVRSMGPISEVDMVRSRCLVSFQLLLFKDDECISKYLSQTYSMDCYFRQSWVDKRLAFKGAQDTLALSISMLARIWKPDTYFYNGKQSYLHTITTPNKFVRIYQDGRVLYSSRLTIKAGCPMNLEDFPMDIQRCPLKFGSFGYTTADVIYRWNRARQAVAIAEDMKLSQFDLVDCPAGNSTDTVLKTSLLDSKEKTAIKISSQYSMLMVNFHLQRHMGNFLIQVYGPCCLLVVLSWVSFWLNREATADRVSLGITTVLTMTFLGLEARTDLPKVPYPTALDFFVFLSFAFIFATIIQFAVVHYFTKYGSGECYFIVDEFDSDSGTDDEKEIANVVDQQIPSDIDSCESRIFEVIPLSACSMPFSPTKKTKKQAWFEWACFKRKKTACHSISEESTRTNLRRLSFRQNQPNFRRKRKKHQPHFNSVSKIDRASRIVFPLLFLIINLFYWCAYLSRSERWSPASAPEIRCYLLAI